MYSDGPQDSQPIYSIYQDDPEMADILDLFIQELPERIAKLEGFLHSHDERSLRYLAHQLKGSGAGYGFGEISEAAANVEGFLVENGNEAFDAQLVELQKRMDTLLSICRRVIR
ncbi:MAG: Hpt domain-containing protein [Phycisphaeraceae bacterium]|nr:Hpt domain-containing protein [Phycisphaerales bacterium]MCB9861575.1 Hpt domain-containing protein [Phycisphaeraceae bacterium]